MSGKKSDEDAILAMEISPRALEIIKCKANYAKSARVTGESLEDTMVRIGRQNLCIDILNSIERHKKERLK